MDQKLLTSRKKTMWAVGIPGGKDSARYCVCPTRKELLEEIRFLLKEGEKEFVVKTVEYSKEELEDLPEFDRY